MHSGNENGAVFTLFITDFIAVPREEDPLGAVQGIDTPARVDVFLSITALTVTVEGLGEDGLAGGPGGQFDGEIH